MKRSKHPELSDLSSSTIARIRRFNAYDIELYKLAEQMFEELMELYRGDKSAGKVPASALPQMAPVPASRAAVVGVKPLLLAQSGAFRKPVQQRLPPP